MYIGLNVKYRLFLSVCNENGIFPDRFSENIHTSNFMKIRPVAAELFHADRRTDRNDEVNSRFFAISLACLRTIVPTELTDRSLYTGTDRVFCEAYTVFAGRYRLQI